MASEKINELSLLDIIENILKENKEPISIYDLIEKAATLKGLDTQDVDQMTQLYIDITMSGKFVFVGDDKWALKDGHLEFWDKDGYAFIQPEEVEDIDEDEIDFSEFNLADVEEVEEELEDEDLEDLDEEIKEEKAYVDVGLDLETTDEDEGLDDIDLDLDDDYDEDDYNDIMDDYEDMYDE